MLVGDSAKWFRVGGGRRKAKGGDVEGDWKLKEMGVESKGRSKWGR